MYITKQDSKSNTSNLMFTWFLAYEPICKRTIDKTTGKEVDYPLDINIIDLVNHHISYKNFDDYIKKSADLFRKDAKQYTTLNDDEGIYIISSILKSSDYRFIPLYSTDISHCKFVLKILKKKQDVLSRFFTDFQIYKVEGKTNELALHIGSTREPK